MGATSFLLMLLVAAVVGIIAEILIPGRIPAGLAGAIIAGLVGAWVGGWLFQLVLGTSVVGTVIEGIAIIPAAVGAAIVVLVFGFMTGVKAT